MVPLRRDLFLRYRHLRCRIRVTSANYISGWDPPENNMSRIITLIMTILLCVGCSGGGDFTAQQGPFTASFTNEQGETIGAFSFTVINNVLQGTGLLTHGADSITVTVSASVDGKVVNGNVNNSTFGSGPFFGTFQSSSFAEGGFTFTGNAGVQTTSGEWSAMLEQ